MFKEEALAEFNYWIERLGKDFYEESFPPKPSQEIQKKFTIMGAYITTRNEVMVCLYDKKTYRERISISTRLLKEN